MKVQELLSDESKWCCFHTAKNIQGNQVDVNSPDACRFCLLGALDKCYEDAKVVSIKIGFTENLVLFQ